MFDYPLNDALVAQKIRDRRAKAERLRERELAIIEAAERWQEKEAQSREPIYGVELNLYKAVRAYKAEKEGE